MPKEENGYKMHMIVPKPTDPEALKKREELLKRSKEFSRKFSDEKLKEVLGWVQAKMEQEERERKEQEERERKEQEERERKEQEERERKEQEERERKEKSTEEELFDALKWISDGDLLNSMAKIEAARLQAKAEKKNKGGSKKK